MMYHEGILCVSGSQLIKTETNPGGIISKALWDKWIRNGARVVQKGGNCRPALVEFCSIPEKYQSEIKTQLGVPEEQAVKNTFESRITPDPKAVTYFTNYVLADGRHLEERYIKEYCTNADVLNAIHTVYSNQAEARKLMGGTMKGFWQKASDAVNTLPEKIKHSLPTNSDRLQKKYKAYQQDGYAALVSKKFCNDNTLKVTADMERLFMSLYTMPNKPFAVDVFTLYNQFLAGSIQLVDQLTGELFNPEQFRNNKGDLITVTDKTIWNWLNKPQNRPVVDSKRNSQFGFNNMHRPHHHRKPPVFSFSKISMDDRDLPRRSNEGGRVKAYYAYDVTSGCVIGSAYSRSKDEELFLDCLRNMFRLIERERFPMPLEVEVENHLVNKFFDDLDAMFSFVRICNPGNSQEKRAEHFNRAKKYGVEKKMQNGIGRWWAKSEAYRIDAPKVNDEFVEKLYSYDTLVADDIFASLTYNNQLHPKQKKYPGKTRWQVLLENLNPNASQPHKARVYRSIGERTATSIQRNQYCQVQYADYTLPNLSALERLQPNNYEVQAYYLPNAEGVIDEVFIYQGDVFIAQCPRINQYNEAKAEWIEGQDDVAYNEQAAYVGRFDAHVKTGKEQLAKVALVNPEVMQEAENQTATIATEPEKKEQTLDELLSSFSAEEYARKSQEDL